MKKLMMTIGGLMAAATVWASTAPTFAYQGVLRDEMGQMLTGVQTVAIDFRLYEGAESDSAVWGRKMTVAIDTNGLFNAELSDANGNALSGLASLGVGLENTLENVIAHAEQTAKKALYVGLTVANSSGEIRPRQKLLSVPMAAYAQDVSEAKGDFTVAGTATFQNGLSIRSGKLVAEEVEMAGAKFSGTAQMENGAVIGGSNNNGTNLTVNGQTVAKGNILLGEGSTILMHGKYEAVMPIGTIIIWSGSPNANALPPGWRLCAPTPEGKTLQYKNPYSKSFCDVPDLRGRFVLGANAAAMDEDGNSIPRNANLTERSRGATGGLESVTMTTSQLPAHTHALTFSKIHHRADIDAKDGKNSWYMIEEGTMDDKIITDENGKTGQKVSVSSAGDGAAHENMPPFYALCYIIFIGDAETQTK